MPEVNLQELKMAMAEHKVFDAWQYVESMSETMAYMRASYILLDRVHQHRVDELNALYEGKWNEALEKGSAQYVSDDFNCTHLNIGGFEIDDAFYLRKTTVEFFHYARVSMDTLFQIVNAALLGEESFESDVRLLGPKLINKLQGISGSEAMVELFSKNKEDHRYQYLMAFDNHLKHIRTIPITIKNKLFIGNTDIFEINGFRHDGVDYPKVIALEKAKEIYDYVYETVNAILIKILELLPQCGDNTSRIQDITYKIVFNGADGKVRYASYFVDVESELSELPSEIKVHPLRIYQDQKIEHGNAGFEEIFIRKKGSDEAGILGVALSESGVNEFYRSYKVESCTLQRYLRYIDNPGHSYTDSSTNPRSMHGSYISENPDDNTCSTIEQ